MAKCTRTHGLLKAYAASADMAASQGTESAKALLRQVVAERSGRFKDLSESQFHFLQLYTCVKPLQQCIRRSQLSDAADWIAWSLSENIRDGQVQQLDVNRLLDMRTDSCLGSWPRFLPTVASWLTQFYFYARARATMDDVARSLFVFWDPIFTYFLKSPAAGYLAETVGMMVSWIVQKDPVQATVCVGQVERLVSDDKIPMTTRARIVVLLTTQASRFSTRRANEWAAIAISDYWNELAGYERLQALTACATGEKSDPHRDALLEYVRRHRQQDPISVRDTLSARRSWEAQFDLFQPIVAKTLMHCQSEYLWTALTGWYGVNDNCGTYSQEIVFFSPFHHCGLTALFRDECASISDDSQELLERLTRAADEFYGTSTSVRGQADNVLHLPERFGIPTAERGPAFERALVEAVTPKELRQFVDKAAAQLVIGPCHPVQGTQLAQWGRTLPLVASLRQPFADRAVRTVGIWTGGDSHTEQLETDFLVSTFRRHGIGVEVASGGTRSQEQFHAFYSNQRYDIVWVSSHGEYDHWRPDEVKIQIAPATFVYADALIGREVRGRTRRLLVLNICDGGRYPPGSGALPYIGFAPSLTTEHQATISHLWPVEGFSAALFGALLGKELVSGKGFFPSFCSAILQMRSNEPNIADVLSEAAGGTTGLSQRLANQQTDFSNIARWGSGVFFQ